MSVRGLVTTCTKIIKANFKKIPILESVVPAARGVDYLTMAKLKLMEGKVIILDSQTAIVSGRMIYQVLR